MVRWAPTNLIGVHRLILRPPVVRRKIAASIALEQELLTLAGMPTDDALLFAPPLTIDGVSSSNNGPIQWAASFGETRWRNLKRWTGSLFTDRLAEQDPHLQLEASGEQAQSLA